MAPADEAADRSVPLRGSTVITGPSNVGKTRLTARALDAWVAEHGPEDLVVFEFGPELELDGRILGGHLTRFTSIPPGAFHGVLEAHAPRAASDSTDQAEALARDNADRVARIFAAAPPDPRAVFVNDATIPFQHEAGDLDEFLAYCDGAECAVLNAFESEELGTTDPISRRERAVLDRLKNWADRVVSLTMDAGG